MPSKKSKSKHPLPGNDFVPRSQDDRIWDEVLRRAMKDNGEKDTDETKRPSIQGRRRIILRHWPRDPKGPPIKATPEGKQAGNGLELWGATLLDFYSFHRIPDSVHGVTLGTGSKLSAWARSVGELDAAEDEIRWAEQEQEPIELQPCDISKLIEDLETRVRAKLCGKSLKKPDADMDMASADLQPKSIFDPASYPSPWPLVPFSTSAPPLQQRIPYHLLPKKLIVHDPDGALFVDRHTHRPATKGNKSPRRDVVRTYLLQLSPTGKVTADADRIEAEQRANEEQGITLVPEVSESCDVPAPVRVKLPPRPQMEEVPEAHLYLSKAHSLGIGNHSVVYNAEWEVPRSLLFPPALCSVCINDSVQAELKKSAEQDTQAGGEGAAAPAMGRVTVTTHVHPGADMSIMSKEERAKAGMSAGAPPADGNNIVVAPEHAHRVIDYSGPVREVAPPLQWQGAAHPVCAHRARGPAPPTATVRVAAKLSLEGDPHLRHEARSYQRFPKHLFQHWSGYNVLPPLHDPVPVGAVVPQFYGYYVPEKTEEGKYLSPIMLLEDCGKPIDPRKLNMDDRQECAGLLFRLHHAGFLHNSVFERNIVMQEGDLRDFPIFKRKCDRRFRLIDFGRAQDVEPPSRSVEEMGTCELLSILQYSHD